jgi:hypothetical protein
MQSKPSHRLYSSVYLALVQLLPQEIDSRLTNMAFLMIGIFGARSVQTGRLAAYIPLYIKKLSIVRRMERFLDNGAVRVRSWYEPVAHWLLHASSVAGEIALVIDSTKVSAHHRLVLVGVAYRQRVIPVAWSWVRSSRGHSSTSIQIALLSYVRSLLPVGVQVSVVGDCEFGHMPIVLTLQEWAWDYVLRQRGQVLVDLQTQPDWLRLDALLSRRGEWRFVSDVFLTAAHQVPTHLLLAWQRRYPTPWLLATNLTDPHRILRLYRRRIWIEETFGDLKANGFDLERSALCHFLHLSRLTLAVVLLYVWFIAFGTELVKQNVRSDVDRSNRRDLSLFRIAWDFLQRALLFDLPFTVSFSPFFGVLPNFHPSGW